MYTDSGSCPTLTVPSNPRVLSLARTFVESVCQARQVDRTTIHAIVLATGEAVTNIVRHAHRDQPEAHFEIQCRVGPDTVEIILVDQGVPFDLTQVPHMDPGELRPGDLVRVRQRHRIGQHGAERAQPGHHLIEHRGGGRPGRGRTVPPDAQAGTLERGWVQGLRVRGTGRVNPGPFGQFILGGRDRVLGVGRGEHGEQGRRVRHARCHRPRRVLYR